jgi:putative DNA primase/helicase
VDSDKILECLGKNEDGDAELLREVAKDRFCFDHRTGQWFKFCGHYWAIDERAEIFDMISRIVDIYSNEAQTQLALMLKAIREDNEAQKDEHKALLDLLRGRISKLQAKHRKENIITLSRNGADSLGIAGTEWDLDPWVLPCQNGIINLRTGELRGGEPSDYFKIIAPTEYLGADHTSPAWEMFLDQVFDKDTELVTFVQTLLGGSLIGRAVEHFLAIFVGRGRNGKDTLLESIRAVLGPDIASPIQSETLLSQSNVKSGSSHSADVVSLKGKRVVWASETSEERKMNAEKIKLFTGGGSLHGREPYAKRPITFTPSHNVFLLTNFKPRANADDYALWKRIHIVIFPLSFVENPAGQQERLQDPNLLEKLTAEKPGILSWLIRGCMRYQEQGKLKPPEKVRAAVEAYRVENDMLNLWISENCHLTGEERAGVLFEDYKAWSQKNGNEYLNRTQFGKKMKDRFDSYPGKWMTYIGISLNKEDGE